MTDHTPSDWYEIAFELAIAAPVLILMFAGAILYTKQGIDSIRRRFHR